MAIILVGHGSIGSYYKDIIIEKYNKKYEFNSINIIRESDK